MKHTYLYMLLCLVCTTTLFAQKRNFQLDEVEVVGQQQQTANQYRNTIITLDAEQIQATPSVTLNELLDLLPGVDIRTRGANGAQADISMRGGTNDQVLTLLNGVNITDPRTGHANLDLPIDLATVSHIEVLQGTALEQFGLNAFAGAINIITMQPMPRDTMQHHIALSAGSYGYIAPSYAINQQTKKVRWQAATNYNHSTGYIYNTDYSYANLFTAGEAQSQAGEWQWQVGSQYKKFGSNAFYTLKYPDQYETTKALIASASWNKYFNHWQLASTAYYRLHHDTWYLFRPNTPNYPANYNPNRHITQTAALNFKAHYSTEIGRTSFGFEVRNEHILSSVLGELRDSAASHFNPYAYEKNRLNINYFAQQTFVWADNWTAQIGLAGNYNTMFRHNYAFNAQIAYIYAPQSSVYASANRTLRLPTFTDLYYKSVSQIANSDLSPEHSYNFEIGTKYNALLSNQWRISLSVATYYRIGKNIIDWAKRPQDEKWLSMNHTRVDAMGGEATLQVSKNKWFVQASYSFTNLVQTMDKEYADYISKYALDYLRHKATLQFGHPIYKGFGGQWTLTYQQRNGDYINAQNEVCAYKAVYLLDGRLFWKNNKIEVYAEGSNLLNLAYYDYGGIEQPRRWLKAGIVLNL